MNTHKTELQQVLEYLDWLKLEFPADKRVTIPLDNPIETLVDCAKMLGSHEQHRSTAIIIHECAIYWENERNKAKIGETP